MAKLITVLGIQLFFLSLNELSFFSLLDLLYILLQLELQTVVQIVETKLWNLSDTHSVLADIINCTICITMAVNTMTLATEVSKLVFGTLYKVKYPLPQLSLQTYN